MGQLQNGSGGPEGEHLLEVADLKLSPAWGRGNTSLTPGGKFHIILSAPTT